jgi:Glycosyltransferase family 87
LVICVNPITAADSATVVPPRLFLSPVWWARGVRTAAGSLRDLGWLDAERARVYAVALTIVWVGILAGIIGSLHGGHNSEGLPFGVDYPSFWAASRLVLTGLPADVYVVSMHRLAELPVLVKEYAAFYYPPPYLVLCIPLAILPFFPSLIVFLCTTGVALAGTVRGILRTAWAVPALLAYPAVLMNIVSGQNAFLTAAILGSGLTILDRRPKLSGAILGLMIIKPHLALGVPIALIIWRRWTALTCAAGAALGLIALSYLIFGWDVWVAFFANAHNSREALEEGAAGFTKLQSAFAVARWLGFSVAPAYIVQGVAAALAIFMLIQAQRQGVSAATERSLIVLAGLLMTPFLLFYDMIILVLPLAWMLREWSDRGFRPWSKLVLLLVFCAPIGVLAFGPMQFGLLALLLFGGYLVWFVPAPSRGHSFAQEANEDRNFQGSLSPRRY